jgi:ABC-2 type transport system permease protein
LTALVVSREWERGTMEALLATRVKKHELLLSKYIPYFILGMLSLLFSLFSCVVVFKIPFHGSFLVFFVISGLFLSCTLLIGLLISTAFKDQFLASQTALSVGFLPALFLSGLIYPIYSMPEFFQALTTVNPARYYVSYIQSEFMVGTVWEIILPNLFFLVVLGTILAFFVYKKTKMGLD